MQTDKHDVDLFSRSLAADIIIRRRFLKKIGPDSDNDRIETCVCVYVCMFVCMYVCVYIYIYMCVNK